MPYKNPEDKKAWRKGYVVKQRQYERDWKRRKSESERPAREAARKVVEAKREKLIESATLESDLELLAWAINEVRRRIMVRDGLK